MLLPLREEPCRLRLSEVTEVTSCSHVHDTENMPLSQTCEDLNVSIDAVFTHFADSDGDAEFTRKQLDVFLDAVEPFR